MKDRRASELAGDRDSDVVIRNLSLISPLSVLLQIGILHVWKTLGS